MKEIPFIASLYYKDILQTLNPKLQNIGISYISIYLLFPNGERFVLTNYSELAKNYYIDDAYLKDKNFFSDMYDHGSTLFPEDTQLFGGYEDVFAGRFNAHWNYYTAWKAYDCQIIVGALSNIKRQDNKMFHKMTKKRLQNILCSFFDSHMHIFTTQNPNFKNTRIFSDGTYRRNLIQGSLCDQERNISDKELMALYWSALGKTSEEASMILGVSKNSINTYRQNVTEKLNCSNITHAVFEASKRGIFSFVDKTHSKKLVLSNLNSIKQYSQETAVC